MVRGSFFARASSRRAFFNSVGKYGYDMSYVSFRHLGVQFWDSLVIDKHGLIQSQYSLCHSATITPLHIEIIQAPSKSDQAMDQLAR